MYIKPFITFIYYILQTHTQGFEPFSTISFFTLQSSSEVTVHISSSEVEKKQSIKTALRKTQGSAAEVEDGAGLI